MRAKTYTLRISVIFFLRLHVLVQLKRMDTLEAGVEETGIFKQTE